jgi:hypothetical protein
MRLFLSMLVVLVTGSGGPPPVADDNMPVSLSGQVLAGTDSTPLKEAMVYVDADRSGTATDSLGHFHLVVDLPIGTHRVTVRFIGYVPVSKTFTVDSASSIELGVIVLKPSAVIVEDLIVTFPSCTRYRQPPPDSLRRYVRNRGHDRRGQFWEVCKP